MKTCLFYGKVLCVDKLISQPVIGRIECKKPLIVGMNGVAQPLKKVPYIFEFVEIIDYLGKKYYVTNTRWEVNQLLRIIPETEVLNIWVYKEID